MKNYKIIVISLATLTLFAGQSFAQRGGGGGGGGRGGGGGSASGAGGAPNRASPSERPPTMRPADQPGTPGGQHQADAAVKTQERAMVSLAERMQQQSQLSRELGLSDEQQAAVARIRERERNEIRTINQERTLTREQQQARIRETMEKNSQEVRGLLSGDQVRKLDQITERDRDRDRIKDQDRDRIQDQDRDKDRDRIQDKDRDRIQDKDRDRDQERIDQPKGS